VILTEEERREGGPYCSGCGQPGGEHAGCRGVTDPPRYCRRCGRRLAVQVLPLGYTATCVRCGSGTS
jgi:hypothetical protein